MSVEMVAVYITVAFLFTVLCVIGIGILTRATMIAREVARDTEPTTTETEFDDEFKPTIFDRITVWNDSRGLLSKEYHRDTEILNILEECVEITLDVASNDARVIANSLLNHLTSHHKYVPQSESSAEVDVDGFCDITTFASGAIRKKGYCVNKSMDETLKEIESRKGSIVDGKFVKDLSGQAVNNWYRADYSKAKLLNTPSWLEE